MKPLLITTAINPSSSFRTRLSTWLKEEVDQKAILDIQVDPSIVAGAIVIFAGRYRDLSVKKDLKEYLEKRKKEILEKISNELI